MTEHRQINADMSRRVVIETADMVWESSPSPTVWRKRLHLDGPAESGRVTSVVRYDPDSAFREHGHPEGEEIFVLDGVFSDEHGDYPAGTYLLNPEGFQHAPFSRYGCTLFVKLRQYGGADRPQVKIDTRAAEWLPRRADQTYELPLYEQQGYPERTSLIRFEPGGRAPRHDHPFGEEMLVLAGTLEDEHGVYPTGTWIRSPVGSAHAPFSTDRCTILLKTGSVLPTQ